MTLPQSSPRPAAWESLPPARQQELTRLLAALLTQYLTAQTNQRENPQTEEATDERPSPNP